MRLRWTFSVLLGCGLGCGNDDGSRASLRAGDGGAEMTFASVATSGRSPFLLEADPIDRTHPAYGLTLYHMTNVLEAPRKDARVLGYVRRGARFRTSEEVGRDGCARGWYGVLGGGFVCHGEGVLIDSAPPPGQDAPVLPALSDALPYRYMKTTNKDVPQYVRLPTVAEEQATLSAFAGSAGSPKTAGDAGATSTSMLPPSLAPLVRTRMQPGFYVSIDREVRDESSGRTFLRTVRGGYIRAEQLVEAKLPAGLGVALGGRLKLPIAFVYRAGTPAVRLDALSKELVKATDAPALLPVHSAHQLTGEVVNKAGRRYYVTAEGLLLRDSAIRIVDRVPRPKHTGRSERWIRVDLDRQTLTAYESDRPVFATLIASGTSEHATPTGVYRLHAKHVATTMADDMAADGPYSIEDVPWTMYFLGGYALHAAFWHDKFGNRRSHGCVNLAPRDARWLFFWSAPDLPSGWHGALAAVGKGTVVSLDSGTVYALEGS
jgi:hypothetical protein